MSSRNSALASRRSSRVGGGDSTPASCLLRLEDVFDDNVALLDGSRVRKLRGATRSVLPDLVDGGETFDLVYVDASHRVLDVLVDAALSWRLLAPSS